ncbi:MAG TPA: glycoside hydrolase family 127 protein, partial [Chitinophagaceae bacterium]
MKTQIQFIGCIFFFFTAAAQQDPLVNTSASTHAVLHSVDMGDVQWTKGFWAERFAVCRDSMIPHLWQTYNDPHISHAFKNFESAAGLDTGSHAGPPFHDGDFYKLLEGVASLYAMTKDKQLDRMMDRAIEVIARSQRADGYIHTPEMIEERNNPGHAKAFSDRLNFETYNMGHLMTAACVHYRATGKKSLLQVAIKAADYLDSFYKHSSPELARNAICPSHYMGIIELYRTTHNPEYLRLAKDLVSIRGLVDNGTDDNQDRIPFRQQTTAMGHAVRANYLYAGVADVYAETGDDSLWYCLNKIWEDVVYRKMYVTGGCGALYDGVSPYGVSYSPPEIQEVHQAYGRDYQLPNMTAHNETCANIGNLLWNWRMLQVTGDARYADVVELELYNSILSGISLDGNSFFYTNPLSASAAFPYQLRWSGGREKYITLSNCCPPNVVRTIAEVPDYMYSISSKGLWFNLYGGNQLTTHLADGSVVRLSETTDYPWDGKISIAFRQTGAAPFAVFLRIPGWCRNASLLLNGRPVKATLAPGQYASVTRSWKTGDTITLQLPMPVTLVEANPLVEETRNQVAVKRGPVVYCLESAGL